MDHRETEHDLKQLLRITERTGLSSVYGMLVRLGEEVRITDAYEDTRELLEDFGMNVETFRNLFAEGVADARMLAVTDREGRFLPWQRNVRAAAGVPPEIPEIRLKSISPLVTPGQPLWTKDNPETLKETLLLLQKNLPGYKVMA